MSKIQFRNAAHRDFVLENLDKCKVNDCYHRAFFYVMGISEETRMNIGKMFDFKRDCIIPEGMHGGWQTSGTVKVCHLAFNLWNGFTEEWIYRRRQGKPLYTGGIVLLRICSVFYGGYQVEVSGVLQGFDPA